jgi:hypothetical protein
VLWILRADHLGDALPRHQLIVVWERLQRCQRVKPILHAKRLRRLNRFQG